MLALARAMGEQKGRGIKDPVIDPPASLFDAGRYDHPSVQFPASALASG